MTNLIAILICAIEVSAAHFLDLNAEQYATLFQIEIVLLAVLGVLASDSQGDKSVLSVFVLWFSWIALTDWLFSHVQPVAVQYEATVFSFLVVWAIVRPYFFTSATRSDRTVHIAFYKGRHAPFISSLSALIGLPFSSVAIIAGHTALRPSSRGKMVVSSPDLFMCDDFVCIDTGVEPTPEFFAELAKLEGKPTKLYGALRTRCVHNLTPLLSMIGYAPKNIFFKIPSIFYYQVARQANE